MINSTLQKARRLRQYWLSNAVTLSWGAAESSVFAISAILRRLAPFEHSENLIFDRLRLALPEAPRDYR